MRFYVLSIVLFLSLHGFTQGFKAGVFAGMTASQVDGDLSEGYHKAGLQAGIYSRYMLNAYFSLDSEIKFLQKGSAINNKKSGLNYKIKLNYVEVPLIISYKLSEHLSVGGGMGLAYLVKGSVSDPYGVLPQRFLSYTKYDINVIAQLKYALNEHLWFGSKFAYSVRPITKKSPYQFNNLIGICLAYEF